MQLTELKVRCYAEQKSTDSWFAMCVDLNLCAQADSLADVRNKLHEIIKDYVSEALNEDANYINDLIPRKAPLYFRVRYYIAAVKCKYSQLIHKAIHACRYIEPLPVKLA